MKKKFEERANEFFKTPLGVMLWLAAAAACLGSFVTMVVVCITAP